MTSQPGETAPGIHWLRAWGWLAWLLALPVGGLGLFFLNAMFSETGGWHPAPNEAVIVPLTWLGTLLLLLSGWILLRATGSRRRPEDWRTWSPFQPPQVRAICAHMTETERRETALRGALFGIWNAATFFIPWAIALFAPRPLNWILAPAVLLVGIAFYPLWRRIMREFLASTAWARQQGIAPESLRPRRGDRRTVPALGLALLLVVFAFPIGLFAVRYISLVAPPKHTPSAAPLPQGAVELIAVTTYPSVSGQPWWRPDGSLYPGTPLEPGGSLLMPENRDWIAREFAIRCPDLPADASRPVYKIETPDGGVRYGSQTVSEQPSRGVYSFPLQLLRTNRTVDVSAGFASGEWRTVARKEPGSGGSNLVNLDGNHWTVQFLLERDTEDGVGIPVVYTVSDDWQAGVVAVDQDGKQHKAEWTGTGGGGEFSTLEVKFPDLPLAQVKGFCFQVRPYRWARFDDVALYPAEGDLTR